MKEISIIVKAEEFALSEIKKYGLPSIINFETSNEKGLELAKILDANSDIVQIGTRLMDIKKSFFVLRTKVRSLFGLLDAQDCIHPRTKVRGFLLQQS